ncbi:hypothetical protein HUB98_24310 [Paenibacillus barcinonensis]|uniref:Butirosin biosynthesis protein H-like n=1 Tax=Paenibacillus barcinonensis TaxID=198119 RepID=A0A2V4VNP4_PAEBA|nr:hypothetical protein [Paenibacillus barcinonensis]PYE47894.1 hypothetical protein DFQ00_111193 [Paenibacillus barcinonensis]QKS59023.1 hypothetical protein HUB98_24310 [Paenibacillus barcinonensis]
MEDLLYFQGLNCYLGCVVNGARLLGVPYEKAMASLWSETEFTYFPVNGLYLTERMTNGLNQLGMRIEQLHCSSAEHTAQYLSTFSVGEWMIVGMDAFYISDNPFYQKLHGTHYFLAAKDQGNALRYMDPTYNTTTLNISYEELVAHAFDIRRLSTGAASGLTSDIYQETREVIRTLQEQTITAQIRECKGQNQKRAELLAKYVEAMLNNRYLYAHYLERLGKRDEYDLFYQPEFYSRWISVRNGLYKLSLAPDYETVIEQVCTMCEQLIDDELHMAQQILNDDPASFP